VPIDPRAASDPPLVFDPADDGLVEHFETMGWALTAEVAAADVPALAAWVDEIAAWPEGAGEWMHHRELTDEGPKLCRTENFVPFHPGMRALLTERLARTASRLLGEQAVLYKEKINYKLRGGAGFSPHQDAPAYPFIDRHVSCMVAVDDATIDNGCLEVVDAAHHQLLPTDERGCIPAERVAAMRWHHVELRAGQTLWFHSRTPHRSAANHSQRDRRALYPTYNAASAGDLRADYYRAKLAALAGRDGNGRVVLSLIGDFEGRPVDEPDDQGRAQ
jgi:hypothetical protein